MNTFICLGRNKDSKGSITSYTLENEKGISSVYTRDEVLHMLQFNVPIVNLKLTSDGRILYKDNKVKTSTEYKEPKEIIREVHKKLKLENFDSTKVTKLNLDNKEVYSYTQVIFLKNNFCDKCTLEIDVYDNIRYDVEINCIDYINKNNDKITVFASRQILRRDSTKESKMLSNIRNIMNSIQATKGYWLNNRMQEFYDFQQLLLKGNGHSSLCGILKRSGQRLGMYNEIIEDLCSKTEKLKNIKVFNKCLQKVTDTVIKDYTTTMKRMGIGEEKINEITITFDDVVLYAAISGVNDIESIKKLTKYTWYIVSVAKAPLTK